MKKKLLCYVLLVCSFVSYGQLPCPTLTTPTNGSVDVPVDTVIEWNRIMGVSGYEISIGTTMGADDILSEPNGNSTSFTPPIGLPENTDLFVTITMFFFNDSDVERIVCDLGMFRTVAVTTPPNCTTPIFPEIDATDVNIGTSIAWAYAPTATGYRISIGTTPGGNDIENDINIVGNPSYQPAVDLPLNTEVFVTITPYNNIGRAITPCQEYSFTTGDLAPVPVCTSLINPINGAINVELSPILEWTAIPDADGYRVTIGTTPFNANVLNNTIFTTNSSLFIEFEPNLTFFVTIIPFNVSGDAIGCTQESFSTILGCGPFFDSISGEFVDLAPEIDFPDALSFCRNDLPFMATASDIAAGYRWYKLDASDNETLISMTNEVELTEIGRYRYEAYNTAERSGNTIECANSKIFNVVASGIAENLSLTVTGQNGTLDISVQNEGIGDYEYAIDDASGPYQDNPNFQNIPLGLHIFYVRDKNGCGISEVVFEQDLSLEGFPKFFTPNGDGINDFWQILPPLDGGEVQVRIIEIFDRYGSLLAQIDPTTRGWDGNFQGTPLPSSDYWFRTISLENKKIQGHFTLKR